ncbi:hypothetical protein ACFP2H_04670, partial [Mycolicibacterium llatzerense]|uniref:hypothetical protein n=2 Tax=Mycolicibacterium llatzerense TaxID=280871 RepID=UPI00361AB9F2
YRHPSSRTPSRYLRCPLKLGNLPWQLAAKAGHCTPAEQLSPRLEDGIINFDDAEEYDAERDQWCRYYRAAKKPHEPKATGDKADSVSQQTETKDKANRAVDALVDTSEKLAKNLCKVVEGVGPKLTGDQSELAAFVERLRETRSALDQQCKEIDQILERIGFGDREEKAA